MGTASRILAGTVASALACVGSSFYGSAQALAPPCHVIQVRLSVTADTDIVPRTQQSPVALELRDSSRSTCEFRGYPTITLVAHGRPLSFRYRDSGDSEVTARPPVPVTLSPRQSVWVLIDKPHCQSSGATPLATAVFVAIRHLSGQVRAQLHPGDALGYCSAPDIGHYVYVSPFEPNLRDAERG